MSDRIVWWPASMMKDSVTHCVMLLMRYDWPDERLYEVGLYDPKAAHQWVNDKGDPIDAPDYVTGIAGCLDFLSIPPEKEFTFGKDGAK